MISARTLYRRGRGWGLLLLLLLWMPAVASAQTSPCGPTPPGPVGNPKEVCFEPSPDHDKLIDGTLPAVSEYALEIYLVGGLVPIYTASLGKPAVVAGAVRAPVPTIPVMEWFIPHEARVVAVGPTGSGRSEVSNRFFIGTPRPVRGVVFLPQ